MLACLLCFSHVWLFVTPWTVARQAPLSMGIFQARILEWVAMPSSWPKDGISCILCIGRWILYLWASLVAQLVKNPPARWETWFDPWVRKIPWRRDRLPTPVFLGFPGGSAVKKLPAIRGTWIRSLGWEDPLKKRKEQLLTPVFWPGEFHGSATNTWSSLES